MCQRLIQFLSFQAICVELPFTFLVLCSFILFVKFISLLSRYNFFLYLLALTIFLDLPSDSSRVLTSSNLLLKFLIYAFLAQLYFYFYLHPLHWYSLVKVTYLIISLLNYYHQVAITNPAWSNLQIHLLFIQDYCQKGLIYVAFPYYSFY